MKRCRDAYNFGGVPKWLSAMWHPIINFSDLNAVETGDTGIGEVAKIMSQGAKGENTYVDTTLSEKRDLVNICVQTSNYRFHIENIPPDWPMATHNVGEVVQGFISSSVGVTSSFS